MWVSCPEPESDKSAVTLGYLAQKGHVGYPQISREVLHEILASQLRFGFPFLGNHGMSLKTNFIQNNFIRYLTYGSTREHDDFM